MLCCNAPLPALRCVVRLSAVCHATHRRLVRLDHHVELEAVVLALEQRLLVLVLPASHGAARNRCASVAYNVPKSNYNNAARLYRTAPRAPQAARRPRPEGPMRHVCTVCPSARQPADRMADSRRPRKTEGPVPNPRGRPWAADRQTGWSVRHWPGPARRGAAQSAVEITPAGLPVSTGAQRNCCAAQGTQSRERPQHRPQGGLV